MPIDARKIEKYALAAGIELVKRSIVGKRNIVIEIIEDRRHRVPVVDSRSGAHVHQQGGE